MEKPVRLLVVDDQALYREGLCELIGHWPEFEVVGDASSGEEAIDLVGRMLPELVLMDVQMPGMGGIEATKSILAKHPGVVVAMLTVAADDQNIVTALCAGARGYILKNTTSRDLRGLLQSAARGELPLSGAVADKVVQRMLAQTLDKTGGAVVAAKIDQFTPIAEDEVCVPHLTERELRVLRLVAQGCSNEEIAEQVYFGVGTVKKLLRSIMRKLGLENRVQVAVYAIRAGLAD